jgi:hypothetical protein
MAVIQRIKNLELSGNYPELFLDPSRNAGSLLILDGLNANSIPSAITNGGLWKDLSGKGRDATFVTTGGKLSLDTGIRFSDDNATDYITIPGLKDDLVGRTFAICILSRRTNNPGGPAAGLIGNGVTTGAGFSIGYQPANSSTTRVRDNTNTQAFDEVQWASSETYGGITTMLGLSVQVTQEGVQFNAYKLNDNFTSAILDGTAFVSGATGIFDSATEITIGTISGASTRNLRGYVQRIVCEDLDISGFTPVQFMQREWDNNRSRFVL